VIALTVRSWLGEIDVPGVAATGLAVRKFALGRRARMLVALAVLATAGGAIFAVPATTRQGIDYRVTVHRVPLYVKALGFLQRHAEHGVLVSRICSAHTAAEDCVLSLFDWTHGHIRPMPSGWPVVDDHPLNIVIRGYGTNDQMAAVFTTFAGYIGVPAFFRFVPQQGGSTTRVLSFARISDKWVIFDVERHVVFRDVRGELADVESLASNPTLVDSQTKHLTIGQPPYSAFITREALLPLVIPNPLYGEMQQPLPRFRHALRHVFGLERD
jgi:hypothetical protein